MYFHFLKKIFDIIADLPNVKVADCNDVHLHHNCDKCLVITYAHETEYAGLHKVDGFESVLEGSLFTTEGEEKQGTRVSVTLKDGNKALVSVPVAVPSCSL